jgi:hypothetical protein
MRTMITIGKFPSFCSIEVQERELWTLRWTNLLDGELDGAVAETELEPNNQEIQG